MAQLPNIDGAVVSDDKLKGYLLNHAHPRGAAKARFLASFGFAAERLAEVRNALLDHARQNEVAASRKTAFGIIFEIDGALPSPDGRNPIIRAVWMLENNSTAARLITMIPGRGAGTTRSEA